MALVLTGSPSFAAEIDQTATGAVHRLSADELEAAKEAAAKRPRPAPSLEDSDIAPDRKVHGEVGFAVGTGGYTSVFGTAVMPLGGNGVAAISFERADFGNRSRGRRR